MICCVCLKKKEHSRNILKKISPIVYLLFILSITVFNRSSRVRELRISLDAWFAGDAAFHESNVITSLLNMVLYIPYGFLYKWGNYREPNIMSIGIALADAWERLLRYCVAKREKQKNKRLM